MTSLLNFLLFHCVSLMPSGCGVLASAMLFLTFGNYFPTTIALATLLIFWDPKVTISWCFSDACRLWGCSICKTIFVSRAALVCRRWNSVASDLALWRNVDLSYCWIERSDDRLQWLCEHRLGEVRSLDLSGWGEIVENNHLNVSMKINPI